MEVSTKVFLEATFTADTSEGNAVYQEDGAFANYITAKGDLQIKIPDNLSFEEASTLGVGISTFVNIMFLGLFSTSY